MMIKDRIKEILQKKLCYTQNMEKRVDEVKQTINHTKEMHPIINHCVTPLPESPLG